MLPPAPPAPHAPPALLAPQVLQAPRARQALHAPEMPQVRKVLQAPARSPPLLFLGIVLLLTGCVAAPPGKQPPTPDLYDEAWYQSAPSGQRYRIEPGVSRIQITVRRAGWLRFVGHNHVLVNGEVAGWVWVDSARGDLLPCRR